MSLDAQVGTSKALGAVLVMSFTLVFVLAIALILRSHARANRPVEPNPAMTWLDIVDLTDQVGELKLYSDRERPHGCGGWDGEAARKELAELQRQHRELRAKVQAYQRANTVSR